ncbi:hypothetical protein DPMN_131511 [Dreissena polymorpha]|uniref:Uncharacterized protein n=1 Tax=Dreissena polymorpha TaxID=45954 RepID=A0A9D4H8K2_DREPO|nr:hypothetical protein DPMN_131511 [Dreissena polymorpha]
MVVRTRRSEDLQFAWFEAEVKRRAMTEYNYMWEKDHEVSSLESVKLFITTVCLVNKIVSINLCDPIFIYNTCILTLLSFIQSIDWVLPRYKDSGDRFNKLSLSSHKRDC